MKVKVTKVPTKSKSSEKTIKVKVKSTPEGLPKAQVGTRLSPKRRAQLAIDPLNQLKPKTAADFIQSPEVEGKDFSQSPYRLGFSPELYDRTQNQHNQDVMWNTLDKQGISVPEIKGAPNFKKTITTPQVHAYDFYDPTPEVEKQQRQKKIRKPSNVNYKMDIPKFYPLVGNKYLQQAVMDFNDAATYASNIGRQPKDVTLPPATYNPYVNMYYGEYGGSLPAYVIGGLTDMYGNDVDESGNVLGLAGVDENGNPISKRPLQQLDESGNPVGTNFSQPLFNMETGSFQGTEDKSSTGQGSNIAKTIGAIAGTVAKISSGAVKAVKGGADVVSTQNVNREIGLREAQQTAEAVRDKAMTDNRPQDYIFNRNALGYGGYAADGMQIREIGGKGAPTVEVEGDEHIQLPNGFSQEIKGKKHSEGGIPMNLPQGTKIFSEKLKVPVKFLMELIQINPEYAFLKNISLPKSGNISYADLAKKFETKKYVDLLNSKDADPIQITTAQLMIQQNNAALEKLFTLQEQNKLSGVHGPQVQQNAEQEYQEQQAQKAQQQPQEQMQEPMMMHGGYHLPMAQTGKYVTVGGKQVYATKVKEPGKEYKPVPNMPGYFYKETETTRPGTPTTTTVTSKAPGKGSADFNKAFSEAKKSGLKEFTWNGKKYTTEVYKPTTKVITTPGQPVVTKTEDYVYIEPEQQEVTPIETQETTRNIEMPYMGIGVALPNVYERLPLNWYYPEVTQIDPRYLDIQPELNEIGRVERAFQTNLGSRGASDMANLLQQKANTLGRIGQVYGTKYDYDRAQDAAAQQFNAQTLNDWKQRKQQSWLAGLEDPIRRRESLIGTQQMMDDQAAIENARKMQAFYGNQDYIRQTFNPYKDITGEDLASMLPVYNQIYQKGLEEGKKKQAKYGGKLKIKPKLRK